MSSRRSPSSDGGDGRRERWQAHREQRRTELVDAGVQAIRRHGAGVSMDDIAAEAGTSKAVVYRYFQDKADLYVAVGRTVADELVADITAELEASSDPRTLVRGAIDAYLRRIEAEPELYRFVVNRPLLDRPGVPDLVGDYIALVSAHISRVLGDWMRAAGLDSGAAEPWGYGVVGFVRAAGDWWLERQPMSRAALSEYLTDLIWTGFAGAFSAAGVDVDATPPVRLLRADGSAAPAKRRRRSPAS